MDYQQWSSSSPCFPLIPIWALSYIYILDLPLLGCQSPLGLWNIFSLRNPNQHLPLPYTSIPRGIDPIYTCHGIYHGIQRLNDHLRKWGSLLHQVTSMSPQRRSNMVQTSCLVGGEWTKAKFIRAIFVWKSIEKITGPSWWNHFERTKWLLEFSNCPIWYRFFCSLGCLWQLLRLVVSYIPETVVWWLRIAACLFEADMILISLSIMVADWEKMMQFHKESLLIIHYSYWGAEGRIRSG